MTNYDKYMMAGSRLEIAKAFNSSELKTPCAVILDGEFFTERGLSDEAELLADWYVRVYTPSPKKSPAPTPTEFESPYSVAYYGEGLKTGELGVGDFATEDGLNNMDDFYSYFPADTSLHFVENGGKQVVLYYISSKGDYVTDGEKFTFTEDTESFTITWQDDIPDGKGELTSGFVVRTTPSF